VGDSVSYARKLEEAAVTIERLDRELAVRTAELAEAKRDADLATWMIKIGEWRRSEGDENYKPYSMLCIRLPSDADLSCHATRKAAIYATMQEAK
jgi:hypothetical protein